MRKSPSTVGGSAIVVSHLNARSRGLGVATFLDERRFVMIRLALAEDHTIVRWALREALSKADDIEVVGEAGSAAETLAMVQKVKPDVLQEMRQIETAPLVVVLTWHTEPSYAARAIAAGAHGYVNKAVEPAQLLEAIRAVARGEQIVPPGVEQLLASGDGHPASALTAREQQVMEMLARGMTNLEIAEHLDISIKTVDTHRGQIGRASCRE